MRWAHWIAAWVDPAPTNDPVRTVKPCGPGIPELMPSAQRWIAGDGGKTAGPRGERGVSRKAIAQGRPDVRLVPVVPAACIFFCRRAMGAIGTRPSLRPLVGEGGTSAKLGRETRREAARSCSQRGFERHAFHAPAVPPSLPPALTLNEFCRPPPLAAGLCPAA